MIVHGRLITKVEIDPLHVIEGLIQEKIGNGHVFEKDGKYYESQPVGGGNHSWDEATEIGKDLFNYISALYLIQHKLQSERK